MKKQVFIFIFSCILATLSQGQSTIYVDPNALNGQNNGLDWANAFTSLQFALDAAEPGQSIWAKAGIYYPTSTNNRAISFVLKPGIALYGGFSGFESSLNQRNWEDNKSILSGDIGEKDNSTDNSFHVVTGIGLDGSTLLDGFVLSNGSATEGSYAVNDCGAGLYLHAGSLVNSAPIIQNCIFEKNKAIMAGAGIYCAWDRDSMGVVNPLIKNCIFKENHCNKDGGGIFKGGPADLNTPLLFESCLFYKNTLGGLGSGSGVYLKGAGNTTIFKKCNFEQNSAQAGSGGGVFVEGCGPIVQGNFVFFDSCAFKKNDCLTGLGFLFYELHDLGFYPTVPFYFQIKDCIFEDHKTFGSGAAFEFVLDKKANIKVDIEGSIFRNNISGNNGAVYFSSLGDDIEYTLNINQCIFEYNQMILDPNGDIFAVYCEGAKKLNVLITNTLFANNGAGVCILGGYTAQTLTKITNCTFVNNNRFAINKSWTPTYDHINTYNDCYITNTIFQQSKSSIYNIIFNNDWQNINVYDYHVKNTLLNIPSFYWVPGMFDAFKTNDHIQWGANAFFVDTIQNDFHLLPCSSAVDSGYNAIIDLLQINTDLDDNQRIVHQYVDLGCYETTTPCTAITTSEISDMNRLKIAPNPSNGTLNLITNPGISRILNITVFNTDGKPVAHFENSASDKLNFDLNSLPSGLYIISIQTTLEKLERKWIKI